MELRLVADRFRFGFPRTLAIFFSTPALREERALDFFDTLRVVLLAADFAVDAAFRFTGLFAALFFLLPAAGVRAEVFAAFLAEVFFPAVLLPLADVPADLPAVLFLALVLFLTVREVFFAAAVRLAAVRFAAGPFFFDAVSFFPVPPVLLFLAEDALFLAVAPLLLLFPAVVAAFLGEEALVFPLADRDDLFWVAAFFPEDLWERPPLFLPPAGGFVFAMVIPLLNRSHSISDFLLI
jgi:hypothetical protein